MVAAVRHGDRGSARPAHLEAAHGSGSAGVDKPRHIKLGHPLSDPWEKDPEFYSAPTICRHHARDHTPSFNPPSSPIHKLGAFLLFYK